MVGKVLNGKFCFNCDDLPPFSGDNRRSTGAIQVTEIMINADNFFPEKQWKLTGCHYLSDKHDSKFSFDCNSIACAIILLKHSWGGFANIVVDGELISEIDLFEESGSMQYWYPIYLGTGFHQIEVIVSTKKNPLSNGCQVFIIGAEKFDILDGEYKEISYKNRNNGNPYPIKFSDLLSKTDRDALILDCGSGDRNHPDPRIINFEYSRFQSPDVFGDGHKLPFKDNCFDVILSQAVIEHLYDPFTAVQEILRVIKPGGIVFVESAFIQPLHAVPYHYFNTTPWGLQNLFNDFEIIEVSSKGNLHQTLEWFYSLTSLRERGKGDRVDQLLNIAKELDKSITMDELKKFSSYISLTGKKRII